MRRWMTATAVGILLSCAMLVAAPCLWAQAPGGPFDRLSPGNQKAARALFEAQRSSPPAGTRPLTLDEIAARKHSGEGWSRVFDGMKSRGLVDARNLGQVVRSFDERHQSAAVESATVARDGGRGR